MSQNQHITYTHTPPPPHTHTHNYMHKTGANLRHCTMMPYSTPYTVLLGVPNRCSPLHDHLECMHVHTNVLKQCNIHTFTCTCTHTHKHTHTHTSLMLDITIRYTVIIFLVSRGLGTLVAIGRGVHRPHISVHQCFFGLQKRAHHMATLTSYVATTSHGNPHTPCGHNITWQPSHPMWPQHHMATLTPYVASTSHGNPHTLCGQHTTWQPSHPMWPQHHMATLTPYVATTSHGNPHTLCGHNITWQPSHPMWPAHHMATLTPYVATTSYLRSWFGRLSSTWAGLLGSWRLGGTLVIR